MKFLRGYLWLAAITIMMASCSDSVFLTDDSVVTHEYIVRYGTPYYYGGSLLYYYDGHYYYPSRYWGGTRYYRHDIPLRDRRHVWPNSRPTRNRPHSTPPYGKPRRH